MMIPIYIRTKVALRIMKKNFGKKTLRRECVLNNVWMFVNRTLIFRRRTILSASKGCRLTSCTYLAKVWLWSCVAAGTFQGCQTDPCCICVKGWCVEWNFDYKTWVSQRDVCDGIMNTKMKVATMKVRENTKSPGDPMGHNDVIT